MSAPEEETDKPFEPTQKKLEEARKKGEIARSTDLTTAAAYAGFLIVCITFGPAALVGLSSVLAVLLGQSHDIAAQIFAGGGTTLHSGILRQVFQGTAVWFLMPAALAILAVIAQRAFLVTPV